MKLIILTEEQAKVIKGKYGRNSELDPLLVYRPKYLMGLKIPFTEIEEYAIPTAYLEHLDLKEIAPFLKFFPVSDASYYLKEFDKNGNFVRKIYCDINP